MIFESIVESTRLLDCDSDLRDECSQRLSHFPPYARYNGSLADMQSKRFIYSHRHNGMLTPIWPCDDVDGKLAERTIDEFESRGRSLWGAHTVPWQCAANARVGRGETAHALLREFVTTYTPAQGGFNLNYDYTRSGRGIAGPPVFCNEANSGFSAALLEMLLQSHREMIRVFPAVPEEWREISFANLRARGAFLVSASRSEGRVRDVRITSERGGEIRLKNPWPRRIPHITSNGQTVHPTARRDVLSWETSPSRTYMLTA
jgi:alpha-L-fucosidase 2